MASIEKNEKGDLQYVGDTFKIILSRYTDPNRLNLARNAAIYLGKDDLENVKRPLNIVRKGHVPEIFRGEFAEFIFENVTKEVYDHLITYTTRNMRATGGNRALESSDYAMPGDRIKDEYSVRSAIEDSMNSYRRLMESGETKQVSRSAMPISAKMNTFVYQFNFLTLGESVFKQRVWEKGAQGNTVKVVKGMLELCKHMDEELWETFYEHKGTPSIEWLEVKKRLNKKELTLCDILKDVTDSGKNPDEVNIYEYLIDRYGEQKTMW